MWNLHILACNSVVVEYHTDNVGVGGSNPPRPTIWAGVPSGLGPGLQNHVDGFDSHTALYVLSHSIMVSASEFGSESRGSIPRGTTIWGSASIVVE